LYFVCRYLQTKYNFPCLFFPFCAKHPLFNQTPFVFFHFFVKYNKFHVFFRTFCINVPRRNFLVLKHRGIKKTSADPFFFVHGPPSEIRERVGKPGRRRGPSEKESYGIRLRGKENRVWLKDGFPCSKIFSSLYGDILRLHLDKKKTGSPYGKL
jgi:hypothetical protein